MDRWTKILLVPVLVAALVFSPIGFSAFAQIGGAEGEPSGDGMVADLFLLRPVGIVATAFGAACFIVSLPFSAPTKTTETTWQKLVVDPAKFTFARPMGEVEY
jgi:hypothetical protein